ncbi:MAG: DUF4139 domain-containing protein [Deltaproteobacteria bacterium]|nr:DUF4139 domain-containing protein [Deltaproteobacteria bacterium]
MIGPAAATLAILVLGAGTSCKKKAPEAPQVAAELPVQRVVLYRNGVGYFERAGKVTGDEIHFKVREHQVGDFLASLAVVARDGKPVEFVSFPIKKEEKEKDEEPPRCPYPYPYPYPPLGATCPGDVPPPDDGEEEEEEEDVVDVVVKLQGGTAEHDVVVAYVVESPVWRPTYRIVLDEKGKKALLQGWAVVQNLSGEDWKDVWLTVTEGAPLTFRADLGNPYIPRRPLVTDRGEVVQAAVASSVSVSEEVRARMQEMTETEEEGGTGVGWGDEGKMGLRDGADVDRMAGIGAYGGAPPAAAEPSAWNGVMAPGGYDMPDDQAAPAAPAPPPPPVGLSASGAQASLALLALGAEEGGITTYASPVPITVLDEASTMVSIINQPVEATDTLLYRPDSGVPASALHPFRVVRFTNQAGVTLERGPVAIFGTERFLGQGLLEPLPMGATTSIPYALERGMTVSVESGSDVEEARLVKLLRGVLTVKRYSLRKTKYVVQNLTDHAGTLYLQHSRWSGWELRTWPKGSEEVDPLTAIFPIEFPAQGKAELEIVERSPTLQTVQILTEEAATAVRLYLEGPAVDAVAGPALRKALDLREQIAKIDLDISRFTAERDEVSAATYEVQNNLYAIEGIQRAGDLRTRLTTRLEELHKRYAELQTQIIDLTSQRGELMVELTEALRDVTLEVPDEPAAAPGGAGGAAAPAEPSAAPAPSAPTSAPPPAAPTP